MRSFDELWYAKVQRIHRFKNFVIRYRGLKSFLCCIFLYNGAILLVGLSFSSWPWWGQLFQSHFNLTFRLRPLGKALSLIKEEWMFTVETFSRYSFFKSRLHVWQTRLKTSDKLFLCRWKREIVSIFFSHIFVALVRLTAILIARTLNKTSTKHKFEKRLHKTSGCTFSVCVCFVAKYFRHQN